MAKYSKNTKLWILFNCTKSKFFFSVQNVSSVWNVPFYKICLINSVDSRAVHSREAHSNVSDDRDLGKRFLHARAFLLVAQQREAQGPWCDEHALPSSLRNHCENRREISLLRTERSSTVPRRAHENGWQNQGCEAEYVCHKCTANLNHWQLVRLSGFGLGFFLSL